MQIRIRKAGLLSTVQDLGRQGYLSQAVPVSGAMDNLAARIANRALGNNNDCAVIEFNHSGAEFFTETDVLVSLSGDGAYLKTSTGRLPSDRPVFIPAGVTVYLEHNPAGSRSYLAIAGGWNVPLVLGSRSTYITAQIGGLHGRALIENDVLSSNDELTPVTQQLWDSLKGKSTSYTHWSVARNLFLPEYHKTIRVIPEREFNWFNAASIIGFLTLPFKIGVNSNRMGYRLEGTAMHRAIQGELLSTAVTPGTIQVTGDGSLVLLMADCQTTGGYPRIAQVAAVDLPLCAQLKPGDVINFTEITWEEAEILYIEQEEELRMLSVAIAQKFFFVETRCIASLPK